MTEALETKTDPAAPNGATEPEPHRPGPILGQMIGDLPNVWKELMEQFVATKDLNARVTIRLYLKALLDLASVDTEYPAVPALNPDQRDEADGLAPAPVLGQAPGYAYRPRRRAALGFAAPALPGFAPGIVDGGQGGERAIPGARRAGLPGNDIVLG